MVLKCMVESANYTALIANNADAALDIMDRSPVDLVLFEWSTGVDFVDRILTKYAKANLLLMSGQSSEIVPATILSRVGGVLQKPFTSDTLLWKIHAAFSTAQGGSGDGGGGDDGCTGVRAPLLPRKNRQ